jgi:hypothetical protein
MFYEENNLVFKRDEYYGFAFRWYGFDKFGNIAQFRSGYLPVPKLIFSDESAYNKISQYFSELPKTTDAVLVEMFAKMKAKGNGDFIGSLGVAQKGLYAISEVDTLDNGKRIDGYYLVAYPEQTINVVELPIDIRELIEPYYFPIDFSEIEKIDTTTFFECD